MIIMLIYPVTESKDTECNYQNDIYCTETSKLNSLKLILERLSKSQIYDLSPQFDLFSDYNFKNEDAEAHYIMLIKHLVRTIQPNVLNSFYDASQSAFPLLNPLLEYSHHSDVMIKNAARISLMTVFQKCQGEVIEYIASITIPNHINDIILYLKQAVLNMQHFYEKFNMVATEKAFVYYQEELEYIDDILKLKLINKRNVIAVLLNDFIIPFIFEAITNERQEQHISPISCSIGLCLLSKLLQTITEFELKECVMEIVLQVKKTPDFIKRKHQKPIRSLLRILHRNRTNIDTLHALHIFHSLQIYILENRRKYLKYCFKILFTLIKLLKVKYNCNPHMKCWQLKLIISVFEPFMHLSNTPDAEWISLQNFLSEILKTEYVEISEEIHGKITYLVDVIDEEYEVFINTKLDSNGIFHVVNYLFDNNKITNAESFPKLELYHLFCIRYLYLKQKNMEENCLPLMKRKEKIGKIISVHDCIPCKKLICDNVYDHKHFLKITDSQLLIIQNAENYTEGIVVFNSYYKDIIWAKNTNNALKLCEIPYCIPYHIKSILKPLFLQVQFDSKSDLDFVVDILEKSKQCQIKIIMNKIQEILFIYK